MVSRVFDIPRERNGWCNEEHVLASCQAKLVVLRDPDRDFYARTFRHRQLCFRGENTSFSRKKNFFFSLTHLIFKLFFQVNLSFRKKFFQTKRFYFGENLNIFEAFYLILVKKIVRIESAGKGAAIEKSQAVIGIKRINERASFVNNL